MEARLRYKYVEQITPNFFNEKSIHLKIGHS